MSNDPATADALTHKAPLFADGQTEGQSGWLRVTQPMIDAFAAATLDPDPMHIAPDWARANSPYGDTISFGFLTMSLLTHLLHQAKGTRSEDAHDPRTEGHFLNYGFDRMRLVAPVKVGAEVRARFRLLGSETDPKGRLRARHEVTMDIRGEDRPALVAEWLSVWVPAGT